VAVLDWGRRLGYRSYSHSCDHLDQISVSEIWSYSNLKLFPELCEGSTQISDPLFCSKVFPKPTEDSKEK